MSEEVAQEDVANATAISSLANIMQMVIDEVSSTYKCNRGPRASGAMIITRGNTPIIGRVKPCCESAISCLDELPKEVTVVSNVTVEEFRDAVDSLSKNPDDYNSLAIVHDAEIVEINNCMMRHDHCVRNLHAEVDAIVSAARTGLSTRGASIFSINKPCYNCTMHIIAAGISTIYYAYTVYDEQRTTDIIEASGIECIHVPID